MGQASRVLYDGQEIIYKVLNADQLLQGSTDIIVRIGKDVLKIRWSGTNWEFCNEKYADRHTLAALIAEMIINKYKIPDVSRP